MKRYDTCKLARLGPVEILTLPLSSPAAGAVPAYRGVIAPYDTEYPTIRMRKFASELEGRARSVMMTPGYNEMDTIPSPPYRRASSFENRMFPCRNKHIN